MYESCHYQDLADNTRNILLSTIASWWNLPCGAVFSQISLLFTFSSIPTAMIRVIIIWYCSQFLFRFLLGFLSPKKSVLNLLLCLKGLINLLFHVFWLSFLLMSFLAIFTPFYTSHQTHSHFVLSFVKMPFFQISFFVLCSLGKKSSSKHTSFGKAFSVNPTQMLIPTTRPFWDWSVVYLLALFWKNMINTEKDVLYRSLAGCTTCFSGKHHESSYGHCLHLWKQRLLVVINSL